MTEQDTPQRGKVAFVTGAANGIGRAAALAFARKGANIVVADVSEQGNHETARMIEQAGGRVLAVRCDVSRDEDVRPRWTGRSKRSGDWITPSTTPGSSSRSRLRPTSQQRSGTGSSPSTCAACSCA